MQIICTSLQTDNHASTSPLSFYRPDALPAAQQTASKHWRQKDELPNKISPSIWANCGEVFIMAGSNRHCDSVGAYYMCEPQYCLQIWAWNWPVSYTRVCIIDFTIYQTFIILLSSAFGLLTVVGVCVVFRFRLQTVCWRITTIVPGVNIPKSRQTNHSLPLTTPNLYQRCVEICGYMRFCYRVSYSK